MGMRNIDEIKRVAKALKICAPVLAHAAGAAEEGADVLAAGEALKAEIRTRVEPEDLPELEAKLFGPLDLSKTRDQWILCMTMCGEQVRQDIMHEMFKGYIAYHAAILQTFPGENPTDLFKSFKGQLRISDNPEKFIDTVIEYIQKQYEGSNAEFIQEKVDDYTTAVAATTYEGIVELLAELEPALAIAGLMASMDGGGDVRNIGADKLAEMGAPPEIVAAARAAEGRRAAPPIDEIEARLRIHTAVTNTLSEEDKARAERMVWAMHPERLYVVLDDGNVPLLAGVIEEKLTVEYIEELLAKDRIILTNVDETEETPADEETETPTETEETERAPSAEATDIPA